MKELKLRLNKMHFKGKEADISVQLEQFFDVMEQMHKTGPDFEE